MGMHAYQPPEAPGRMVRDANLTNKLIKLNKNKSAFRDKQQPT